MVFSCVVSGSFSFLYSCWGRFMRRAVDILVPFFATINTWGTDCRRENSYIAVLDVHVVSASSCVTSVLCNSYHIPSWFLGRAENLIEVLKEVNGPSHSCIRDCLLSVLSKINFILVANRTLRGKCLNLKKEFLGILSSYQEKTGCAEQRSCNFPVESLATQCWLV